MVSYADPCPLCGDNKRRRHGAFLSHLAESHTSLPVAPLKVSPDALPQAPVNTSSPGSGTPDSGAKHTIPSPAADADGGDRAPSPPKTPLSRAPRAGTPGSGTKNTILSPAADADGGDRAPSPPKSPLEGYIGGSLSRAPRAGTPDSGTKNTIPSPAAVADGGGRAPSPPKTPLEGRIGGSLSTPPKSSDESSNAPEPSVRQDQPDACCAAAAPIPRSSTPMGTAGSRRKSEAGDPDGFKEEEVSNGKKGERRAARASEEVGKEEEEVAAIRIRCKCGRVQEFLYRQQRT